MKKELKGITLIALILTIIVLLILAGVTINMVLGENGLFNKAKTSVGKYENAQEKENSVLAGYETGIDNARETITISREELQQLISEEIKKQMQSPKKVFSTTLKQDVARNKGDYYASTNLNSVDNTFTRTNAENFDEYFSFEAEKGWTVNKSGWYLIYGVNWAYGPSNKRFDSGQLIRVNNVEFPIIYDTSTNDNLVYDYATTTLYLEKNDLIDFRFCIGVDNSTNSYANFIVFAMCK